jgi:hypothetical protein
VHGLGGAPGDSHFFRYLGPHFWLESILIVSEHLGFGFAAESWSYLS